MNGQYEVLNPWAEADPVPVRGISPRVPDLNGKTIGLFASVNKPSAEPIQIVVERKLKARFPTAKFSWFTTEHNLKVTETDDKARFEEWVKEIDTAVAAIGD